MANAQKITKIKVLTNRTNAARAALWFGAGASAMLALVAVLMTLSPVKAAHANSEAHEKVTTSAKPEPRAEKTDEASTGARTHTTSDRTPARVEGDLSPEANELLHDAGQKFERMLDRSTRSY